MLENNNNNSPYAYTIITKDGKDLLLSNENFLPVGYAFTDEEINYNLINGDQIVTKGFERLNQFESDIISDIDSLGIFAPQFRTNIPQGFIFGPTITHQVLPGNIKTENDIIRDMENSPIDQNTDAIVSKELIKTEVIINIVNGNTPNYFLAPTELTQFSTIIDIRGQVNVYQDNSEYIIQEDGSIIQNNNNLQATNNYFPFDSMFYTINFLGNNSDNFTIQKNVKPFEIFKLSVQEIKNELKILYDLYGSFIINKTFVFQGKTYVSENLKIIINENNINVKNSISNDGKQKILESYTSSYAKKNVYIKTNIEKNGVINPKVYGNSLIDSVLNQDIINGYPILNPYLQFRILSTYINSFHLQLQQITTGNTYTLLTLDGMQVPNQNSIGIVTLPLMDVTLTMYKHLFSDGYHLLSDIIISNKTGFLNQDNISIADKFKTYNYSLFGEKIYTLKIANQFDIFLGNSVYVDTLQDIQKLFFLTSIDQTLIYNYNGLTPLTANNIQNFIMSI